MKKFEKNPKRSAYDVIIIGGAIMGSSAAWFLSQNPDFNGSILVVEKDQKYEFCSTAHTTSCMRQQFSTKLNVQISQFAADFVLNLQEYMVDKIKIPKLKINSFGYMYLADDVSFAETLKDNQKIQIEAGAATELLSPTEIKLRYPFYNVEDIILGSINLVNEGYWDSMTVFDCWRNKAQENGVEYIENQVVDIIKNKSGDRIKSIKLRSGEFIAGENFVNASGPRAAFTSKMAGIDIPVEPRKRYSWIFKAEKPLDRQLPLTIDPSGIHVRENGGGTYQAGGHGVEDPAVDFDDFSMDHDLWEEKVWPILAHRIPNFESIKLMHDWAGHYSMNTLDQNAIFLNGFSVTELLIYGEYQTLNMKPFHFDRIEKEKPIIENAII